MSFSYSTSEPKEYVSVVKLVNYYAAIHIKETKKTIISKYAVSDLKVAQTAAKVFAESYNIPYKSTFVKLIEPIFTIIKNGTSWCPAEMYSDRISLIIDEEPLECIDSKEKAKLKASALAKSQSVDFNSSIGRFISHL